MIKRVNEDVKTSGEIRRKINAYLEPENGYEGETKVIHYLELLRDRIGFDRIREKVKQPLNGKKIAPYYGCLLLRPFEVMNFDDPENPSVMEEFLLAIGAKPVHYALKNECCGGYVTMRVLRDEVLNLPISLADYTSAIELILDEEGRAAGAVLMNMETGELLTARAKTVILATGGAGRLHYQGFPTSNHYGATADGLVLAYRAGAKLLYQDTLQYHPTGVAFPEQIYGALVTEKVRSLGAMGERQISSPGFTASRG